MQHSDLTPLLHYNPFNILYPVCPERAGKESGMAEVTYARSRERSRWRRWADYAVGILIEVAAVVTISLLALLVLFVVKVIVA